MARVRAAAEPPPPPPIRPPRELVSPHVEDYVRPDEEPPSPGFWRPTEDNLVERFQRLAEQRHHEAWQAFRAEHAGRKISITLEERRRQLLGVGPLWRDQAAFLAARGRATRS